MCPPTTVTENQKVTSGDALAAGGVDPARKYVVVRGEVYDVTDFLGSHPGGSHLISLGVGRDATILFESYHIRDEVARARLRSLPKLDGVSAADLAEATPYDEPLEPSEPVRPNASGSAAGKTERFPLPGDSEMYLTLKRRVRDEVLAPRGKKYGRGGVVFDTCCVLVAFALAAYWVITAPSAPAAVVAGICGAWIGLGVQHTANHGALAVSPAWNYVLGLTNDVIGGSSLVWRYHHMLTHHLYTNDQNLDMDVHTSFPMVRFDKRQQREWWHRYQFIYAWLIFPGLGFSIHMQDFKFVTESVMCGVHFFGVTKLEYALFWLGKALHFGLFLLLPLYLHRSLDAVLCYVLFVCTGGFTLATLFIVSHNLEDTKPHAAGTAQPGARGILDGEADTAGVCSDWCKWQIETSASWGGSVASFFTGGLNLQIEHHLFPGVAHNCYPAIARVVKDECAKRGVQYHGYGQLPEILWELAHFLYILGRPNVGAAPIGEEEALLEVEAKKTL